jgi:transposase-like protein
MIAKSNYSEEFKRNAVGQIIERGNLVAEVWQQLGGINDGEKIA